ncbi:40S ribosomal protein S12 [Thecamonas trahens ATCC 50062]|uniref:40S ribosomal protein S12 n=1 Tax=Thecamonas trahens ATCC 50062 TaxID=461836 RepID=A0A0L0D4F3_THETB|nr:40S ribosomal protein S12 [Thecamonas trahens ATCC 50062]KNC47189.1 40S ribosomal protein S12 [Thecamonas trahens ATCC 50062]|eukprot:XP_013759960.1 40S ribosomal protein S12 [Thecamonas trahens ATCC 50062]
MAENGDVVAIDTEVMEEVEQVETGPMDPMDALKVVLRNALIHDGLARGLREAVRALDRKEAHLCLLASNCSEPAYTKLVSALCNEHQIQLIQVESNKELGLWAGLCKLDAEGQPRKEVACSCVVIRDYGVQSHALDVLQEYLKAQQDEE